jgi:uncharacterized damage-inducible protein DinB
VTATLRTFYDGWEHYQRLLLGALRDLTSEQLASKPRPGMWAVWQLASHMAGSRAFWFHDILGEGDTSTREMFRVTSTTVPDLPLEDAGWEDDETHPREAADIVDGLSETWSMIDECLRLWSADDLAVEFSRQRRSGETETFTRAWVIWHLMEHDLHHGGEISLILGTNRIPALDL